MMFEQFAGVKPEALALLLPAATATLAPRETAPLMAVWYTLGHVALAPPRLRLMTFAGFALAGTPGTDPPEAQVMASAMSEDDPPRLPGTRTG